MSEHLLTCPICDGPATAMDNGGTDTGPAWIAGCVPCGIWMPAHYTDTEQEAAAAWNRRAGVNRRVLELERAILWALGENGRFGPRPKNKGQYWWRTELRKRAAVGMTSL